MRRRAICRLIIGGCVVLALGPLLLAPAVAVAGSGPSAGDSQYINPLSGSAGPSSSRPSTASTKEPPAPVLSTGEQVALAAAVAVGLIGVAVFVRRRVDVGERTRR